MEGDARSPKPAPAIPREDAPTHRNRTSGEGGRGSFVSVDDAEIEEVPPSVEDVTDGIDVEFDDPAASVNKLLAMTGESWSIDAQRETLKEAAKDKDAKPEEAKPDAKPSLVMPTPYDLGKKSDEDSAKSGPVRSVPPPLPAA